MLFWIALSATGSTLLMSTTNQISQEIAVIPFLWIAPLSLYLLTFVLTFDHARWYRRPVFAIAAGLLVPGACVTLGLAGALPLWAQIAVYLAALFVTCMICHGELFAARPHADDLTGFYLAIAAGGALGGAGVALLAPRVFAAFSEYPIGLAAAGAMGAAGWLRAGVLSQWTSRNLAVRVSMMALLIGAFTAVITAVTASSQRSIASVRNFYGILRVSELSDSNGPFRRLAHGRTNHGIQYVQGERRSWATTYYGPHSGAAIALNAIPGAGRRIAVVGLGTGTLAAWGRPGDTFRFYEINPQVEAFAHRWFTFLKDSKATTEVVLGDARIVLEREMRQGQSEDFDAIAVDAFSSDAIPIHLLTAECGEVYRSRLKPDGLLLLHISNQMVDLEPVTRGMAKHLGWPAAYFVSAANPTTGESASRWVLLTANRGFLERAEIASRTMEWTQPDRGPIVWSDDFASLWRVLKF
jgi:spermidine synthase